MVYLRSLTLVITLYSWAKRSLATPRPISPIEMTATVAGGSFVRAIVVLIREGFGDENNFLEWLPLTV